MTIVWHVDDVKASHKEIEVLEDYVEYLRGIYDDEEIGTIKVEYGPRHDFVGMILDYSVPGKVIIDMKDYIAKMVEDFEYEIPGAAKTPAANFLFKTNEKCPKLNEKMKEDFHTFVAKGLFACKRGRPDTQTAIAFLTTRVKQPDHDDWKKLQRMMSYLKATKELVLTLEADDLRLMRWYVDASFAVHPDMKGHTGGGLTIGKGSVYNKSTKQKINAKSSTETEIIGVDDMMPQVLWTNYFMKAQGWSMHTKIFQDNKSAILLENNGRLSSSSRTKHINVQYYFIKNCIEQNEVSVEHLGTDAMWSDYYTKPLEGKNFYEFLKNIMNL